MIPEREVLISTLKMTRYGSAPIDDIILDAAVLSTITRRILRKYAAMGFLRIDGEAIMMEREQRLRLAVRTLELRADLERVCKLLGWDEFEDISALFFRSCGFLVLKHFRFKHVDKRWEIDILALKNPIAASVDCKHWHRGWRRSVISRIVEGQVRRTQALSEVSKCLREEMGISTWREAVFIPIVLSLSSGPFKFYKDVPIVPILQLRDFLNEMPAYVNLLTHFFKGF